MKKLQLLTLSLLCLLSATSCYTSYYYVVRHAEKSTEPAQDPVLTEAGMQRANALCDSIRNKNVTKIFVSQWQRTKLTARPTAGLLQIVPTEYNTNEPVENLVAQLKAISGPNVLVVGHTSNVPAIVQQLSGANVPPIPETDFDNFFIVKRVHDLDGDHYSLYRAGTYGAFSQ